MKTTARQPSAPERRPVSPAALERSASVPRSPIALQQRLGNQGVAQFVARSVQREAALPVSSPHDPAEREAVSIASAVMRMPAPAAEPKPAAGPIAVQRCACGTTGGPCTCRSAIQRDAAPASTAPSATSDIQRNLSGGSPLPSGVRGFMEPRFNADFSGVRIHTDTQAARLSEGVNANAFTVGNHVFFGRDQYRPDTPKGKELIAHELTHTVQQGASAQPAKVQREGKSWWESFLDFSEDFGWGVVRRVAPSLEPVIRNGAGGVFDWLKSKVTSAVERVFSAVTAPVRAVAGAGDRMAALFGPMALSIQAAAAKIAQNDCSPIREAAEKIEKIALSIITPIVETVQPVVAKVKKFLSDVWDAIGAPVWEWIKQYAADEWQKVKDIAALIGAAAQWIWDKTATIRSVAERAWTWLKNKIGIGDGVEGQNGILQWVQQKLEAAWDWLKAKLEPFKREIMIIVAVIGGVLIAVSPAGPILAVGAAVAGAVQGLRWIAANWGKGNAIVQARLYLEKTLFPQLTGAAQQLAGGITRLATSISASLGNLAGGLMRAVGTVAGSMLSFAVSAVQWIADQAVRLAAWAQREFMQLANWVTAALQRLRVFLDGVMTFLRKVAGVVLNIWGLPVLLAETVWNWVPACIRDPIVDFLGPIILRQIEIFQELAKDNEAWQKTKADIAGIIKLVFKDHDLMGAVKATFRLILRVFNIPPDLLVTIWNKALAAWNLVVKKPLEFIKNTVRALGHGFKLLWTNLWDHLKFGVQGWLFGELADKKINPPASWSDPKAVFNFALEVMGISVDHMFELLAKKFDPAKVAKVRLWFGRVAGAIDWINKAIDTSKSPAENARGLWDRAKEFGSSILTGIAEWIAGKIAQELAIMAAAAAASGGLSEVIDIVRRIYKAILTAVRWARRILDMVNQALDTVTDIATGAIEKVGAKFEQIMHRGMPIVIGFLADQVGLGGIGTALRGIVDKLREKVDQAILWLIDKVKAAIEAIIGAVKAGAAALLEWWREKREFIGTDGKPHTVAVVGGEASPSIEVRSTPRQVRPYLQDVVDDENTKPKKLGFAKRAITLYDTKLAPVVSKTAQENSPLIAEFPSNLTALSELLMEIVGADTDDLPEKPKWEREAPHSSRVELLSTRTSNTGTEPSEDPKGWDVLQAAGLTKKTGDWKRMHMITAGVGGEGIRSNLIPAPTKVNSGSAVRGFERSMEALVKREHPRTKKPSVVWIEVTVKHHKADSDEVRNLKWDASTFPRSIKMAGGLHFPDESKKWVKDPDTQVSAETDVQPPDFEGLPIDLNTVGRLYVQRVTGVSQYFAEEIAAITKPGKWKSFSDFEKDMRKQRKAANLAITKEFEAALETVKKAEERGRLRFGD